MNEKEINDITPESFKLWCFDFTVLIHGATNNYENMPLPEKPWKHVSSMIDHISRLLEQNKKVAIIERFGYKLPLEEMASFMDNAGICRDKVVLCNGEYYLYINESGKHIIGKILLVDTIDITRNLLLSIRLAFAPHSCERMVYVLSRDAKAWPLLIIHGELFRVEAFAELCGAEWDDSVIINIHNSSTYYESIAEVMDSYTLDMENNRRIEDRLIKLTQEESTSTEAALSKLEDLESSIKDADDALEELCNKKEKLAGDFKFLRNTLKKKIKEIVYEEVFKQHLTSIESYEQMQLQCRTIFDTTTRLINISKKGVLLYEEQLALVRENRKLRAAKAVLSQCLEVKEIEYPQVSDAVSLNAHKPTSYNKFIYGGALTTVGYVVWLCAKEYPLVRYSGATVAVFGAILMGAGRECAVKKPY